MVGMAGADTDLVKRGLSLWSEPEASDREVVSNIGVVERNIELRVACCDGKVRCLSEYVGGSIRNRRGSRYARAWVKGCTCFNKKFGLLWLF